MPALIRIGGAPMGVFGSSPRGHRPIAVQIRNWFILFGVVPATVLLLLCLSLTQRYAQHVTEETLRQSSMNFESGLASLLVSYSETVEALAADPEVRAAMLSGRDRQGALERVQSLLAIAEETAQVHLLSADNGFRYSTGAIPTLYTMPVYKHYGIFERAQRAPGTVVMKATMYTSYNKAKMAMMLCSAVWDDAGGLTGFVVLDVPQRTLRELVLKFKPVYGHDMVVVDSAGTVAYSMLHPENEGVLLRDENFLEALNVRGGDQAEWYTRDGHRYAVFPIGGTEFFAGISVSRDLPDAVLGGIWRIGAYILLLTVTVALLAGIALSRKIGAQFERLIDVFGHTERGEFDVRYSPVRGDYSDIVQLGSYYNDLIEKIRELLARGVRQQGLLAAAELKALESQIKPHFIHNILNDIKSLSKLGLNREINELVVAFGRLLRSALEGGDEFITVGEDLELIRSYINMQNIRFSGAVSARIDVDPALLALEIPRLMLQPIVENAFVHGFVSKTKAILSIRGRRDGSQIVFQIIDNGTGISLSRKRDMQRGLTLHEGTGLKNIAGRLRLYYQEEGRLSIRTKAGFYTCVTIRFDETRPPRLLPPQ